ncbi:MAG TPA: GNAT family N-acetyltransferase [Gaiellaceae bacterium]|nr:GNAT family N-acetyltransferase [Gaiellaceae bacterium]
MSNSLRLETDRLVLRRLSPDDVDSLAPYMADPEVMRYMGGATMTREQTAARIERFMEVFDMDGIGQFAIEHKEDGAVLGRCGILIWETDPWTPLARAEATKPTETEIGYLLGRPHWGYGYATEAATAVRDYAQSQLGEERIIALIQDGNDRSKRVAEKLGMAYEREVQLRFARVGLYSLGNRPAL